MRLDQPNAERLRVLQFDPVFYKSLLVLATPIVLQNMVGSMLNMVDNVMVGGLGETSLAAVGIANQIFFIFALVLFGLNASLSIFISQYWGRKSFLEIRQAIGLGLMVSFLFSVVFMTFCCLMPQVFIGIFTRDPAVIRQGSDFLRIVALGYPLTAISMVYSIGLRSSGRPVFPLASAGISLIFNTFWNYVLIYGKFGFPMLGVKGSAIATVFARALELLLIMGMVYRMKLMVACTIKDILCIQRSFVKSIAKVAGPIIANESLWVVGTSVFALVYGRMGTNELASFNIIQTLDKLAFVAILGLGNASAVLVGKQLGEGRKDRAFVYGARANLLAPIVGIAIGAIILLVRIPILSLYDVPPVVKELASTLMILTAVMTPIRSINFTNLIGILRAGGDAKYALALEAIPLWLIAVPSAIFSGLYLHWPLPVVFIISQSEELIKCVIGLFRFISKKWIHNLIPDSSEIYIEELAGVQ